MDSIGFLIGMIIVFALGLWLALTMAEMILMIIGWVLVAVALIGIIKYATGRRGTTV